MVGLGRTGMQWKASKVSGPDCKKGRPFKSCPGKVLEARGDRREARLRRPPPGKQEVHPMSEGGITGTLKGECDETDRVF